MKSPIVLVVSLVAVGVGAAGQPDFKERLRSLFKGGAVVSSDVRVAATDETFRSVSVINTAGIEVAAMEPDEVGEGVVGVADRSGTGKAALLVDSDGSGVVAVFNTAGNQFFALQGNQGLVSGAADMAEVFPATVAGIEPGSVLVIDPASKGALAVAQQPYDRRVAGVASGARNFNPGITLGVKSDGSLGVKMTLSGTVYCRVTNANGAIRAGDLLTTSAVPGHAMRVTDHGAAHGAVLGKAMEDFDGGSGLVLILASLN